MLHFLVPKKTSIFFNTRYFFLYNIFWQNAFLRDILPYKKCFSQPYIKSLTTIHKKMVLKCLKINIALLLPQYASSWAERNTTRFPRASSSQVNWNAAACSSTILRSEPDRLQYVLSSPGQSSASSIWIAVL